MTTKGKTRDITLVLPALIATQEFEPTPLMIKAVCVYLEMKKRTEPGQAIPTPQEAIESIGHNRHSWYNWQIKPLFKEWWNKVCQGFYIGTGLDDVHTATYQGAMRPGGTSDRKLYLDRFDKAYKPATAQDVNYPGIAPPEDIASAVARSKARAEALASPQDSQEAGQEPAQASPGQADGTGKAETLDALHRQQAKDRWGTR